MATQYTSLLGLALPVTGELQGTWGDTVNNSITSLLDTAVAGTTTLSTDGDVTLSTTTGASNQARQAVLLCTGARTALRTITAPAQSKTYTVINATTGGFSIKVVGVGPTTGVTIVAGESALIAWNGSDFIKISNTGGSASFTNVTVSGTTTLSGLTASTALALDASKNVVSVTNTGTGNNVLSASPTLTGTVAGASLQLSSLTSGRVTYATTSGLLTDSANMTFNGTRLTVADLADSGLTATRVVFSTTGGALTDSANLTFNGTDLTVSGAVNAGTINATTLDLTNLEVTNIKAKDGTAGMQIADSTGVVSFTANPVMSGGTANGVAYLNGSKVLTTGSALTFDGTNLGFGGTGQRITGDFSNATFANRLMFQTSTANSSSAVSVLPSGTSSTSAFQTYNNSDPTNASLGSLIVDSGALSLQSTIRGTGTYLPMTLWTGGSERMRLDTSGRMLIGSTSARANLFNSTSTAPLQVEGTTADNSTVLAVRNTDTAAAGPFYILARARGTTVGSTTVVQSGDVAGTLSFQASDGSEFVETARIQSLVDGTPGANDMPGALLFFTTADGAASSTERMRIDSSGNVGIGTSSPGYALQVTRSGAAAYVANTDGTGTLLSGVNGSGLGVFGTFSNTAVAFFSNSSERMRLDSSGNLGIGTSSPGFRLDVAGTGNFQGIQTSGSPSLSFGASKWMTQQETGVARTYYCGPNASTYQSWEIYRATSTGGAALTASFDLNGNLGLGVTPSAWQSIYRAAQFPAGVSVAGRNDGGIEGIFATNAFRNSAGTWTYVNNGVARRYVQEADGHLWLTAPSGTAGNAISFTQAMTLDANGDFLIGSTSVPANGANARNVVFNNSNNNSTYVKLSNGISGATASDGFDLILGTSSDAYVYNRENGPMIFGTNNTERARIDASGNLLVGTTSQPNPGFTSRIAAVQTNANAIASMDATNASGGWGIIMRYTASAPNGVSNEAFSFQDSSAVRFQVRSNGGIANFSGNNVNLSDRREKTNFAPAKSYLETLCAIPVQTFNYIDQNMEDDPGLTLGVVAQDVQAVAPELVMESNWGTEEEPKMRLSIYQTDLQYALMKAIQEQQAIIEQLKADVAALKGA